MPLIVPLKVPLNVPLEVPLLPSGPISRDTAIVSLRYPISRERVNREVQTVN